MIEYVVMGMVLHKPLTGYDIKKEIEAGIGNFYKSSYGNLYPALKKLTDKGYLTLTEQTNVDRLKKYYLATELGKSAFLEWLTSPIDKSSITVSIMTRVFFFGELPVDLRDEQLQEYELHIQQTIDEYKKMAEQFSASGEDITDYHGVSTLYCGLQTAQVMMRWLRHIKEEKPLSEFLREEFRKEN